ncbi:MAG TPA: BACON domain-containing carbohydrate-binding protein [Vicinamibacterales bacterium]|nr:BACON domain-containing carbohydrate-binding protein [Vicinamibacterales bacterium]
MHKRFVVSVSCVVLGLAVACDRVRTPSSPTSGNPVSMSTLGIATSAPLSAATVSWHCIAASSGWRSAECVAPASAPLALSAALLAPSAPSSLAALVNGARVTLSWVTPSAGDLPTSYIVEAGSASGRSDLASFDTGGTVPALNVDSVPAGTYFVRVRAKNGAGVSGPSNEVVVTVTGGGACAPGAPTGLSASASGSTVTLAWTAPGGSCVPTGYVIEAGSGPGLANLANFNTGTGGTTFIASGVGAGTYYVRVRASNQSGTSGPSNEATLVVGSTGCPGAPAAPSLSGSVSGSMVSLAWSGVPGATSYVLEAGSAPGLANIVVGDQGGATSLSAVAGNGTYYVRLRAKNACGTSAPSNEVVLTVPSGQGCTFVVAPTNQSVIPAGGALSATVSTAPACAWTAVSNAPFITITSGASGSGTGTVAFSVAANSGTDARTGTLTIAGQTVTVSQAGTVATTCTFTVSAPGPVDAIGGPATVAVTASAPTCAWTAQSSASFVAVTGGASGTGTGTVGLTVDANGGTARTGSVAVAGQSITVSQGAPTPPLTRNVGCPSQVQTAPTPLQIKFVNATAGTVTVFRPGGNGERNDQRTLAPRTGFAQSTTTNAVWQVVTDTNGCLASFSASVNGGYGVIQ